MTSSQASQEPPHREGERASPEPFFNLSGVVTAIIGLNILVHALRVLFLSNEANTWLVLNFAFIPLRYSSEYFFDVFSFTSPLTYSFLHGSTMHLAINMIWLAAFGSPLANRIGSGRFLLFWAFTALAAVLFHFFFHPFEAIPVVGASGAISGMMGAAARFAFQIDRRSRRPGFIGPVLPIAVVFRSRTTVTFLATWFAINLAVGLASGAGGSPSIAWEAHLGGFVAGFLAIRHFDPASRREWEGDD